MSRRPARLTRAALDSTLALATVWREAARVLPRVAAAEPLPCSLDAGCASFHAGARHGVARGGTCAASGGGSWAVAPLARCGLRWLLRWRAPRCGERRHVCCLGWRQLSRSPARSTRTALASTLARATVWRGGTCAASGGGSWAAAMLARRGLCWLLRWRAPRCFERRHVCCLRWRQLSRHPARSTRAALASTLARATVWRGAAHVLPRVTAAGLLPCSLDAGCASFHAGARHGVAREAAHVLPRVAAAGLLTCSLDADCAGFYAAAEPSPCSLDAGCAGFHAGARHGVARGGTCAASGGGRWAVALLA